MTAHICSYLSAAATRDQHGGQPLFTCGSRAATAKQVAGRVAALAVGLAQRLGVQVRQFELHGARGHMMWCLWLWSCLSCYHATLLQLPQPAPLTDCLLYPAQPGDCVCLAALATDHNLEALLAITAAGGIAAPLNWRWGAAEGAYATGLVDAKLLVADAACLPFAAGVAAAGAAAPGGASSVQALLLLGSPADYRQADLAAVASLQIVFAGGRGSRSAVWLSEGDRAASLSSCPGRWRGNGGSQGYLGICLYFLLRGRPLLPTQSAVLRLSG